MRASSVFSVVVLYELHKVSGNAPISCKTFQSDVSGSAKYDTTNEGCTSAYPTLVSCGFSTKDAGESQIGGSYISSGECKARNAEGGAGVYAWARCCNFKQSVSCTSHLGDTATGDDSASEIQCSSPQTMLGCTAYPPRGYIDGCYPGTSGPWSISVANTGPEHPYTHSRTCTGKGGTSSGSTESSSQVRASANCCTGESNLGLECAIYYAAPGTDPSLDCPSHQSMMSCMAWESHVDANAWYIDGNTCKSRTQAQDVYASAICCNEVTASPTTDPTKCPTPAPTGAPSETSSAPTQPSAAPTVPSSAPSSTPTHTRNPTTNPTEPTTAPTVAPSESPTESTDAPSTAPTLAPSAGPTRKTRDPSEAPTAAPSTAPSVQTTGPSKSPSEQPSTEPSAEPSIGTSEEPNDGSSIGLSGDEAKNKETLYLVLFVVFGILFCCLLAGICSYCYFKNRKQEREVKYENAAVAVAAGKKIVAEAEEEQDDDEDILPGINLITTKEGAAYSGTGAAASAGTGTGSGYGAVNTSKNTARHVDASEGIKTVGGLHKYSNAASTVSMSPGISGMSEEDEQKSAVFKVEM